MNIMSWGCGTERSAARAPGDILIIAAYATYDEKELQAHKPDLVYVDAQNRIKRKRSSVAVQVA